MNTTNNTIKTVYDEAHKKMKMGDMKNTNLESRLQLSGLFSSSVDYKPQQISVEFMVELSINHILTDIYF